MTTVTTTGETPSFLPYESLLWIDPAMPVGPTVVDFDTIARWSALKSDTSSTQGTRGVRANSSRRASRTRRLRWQAA